MGCCRRGSNLRTEPKCPIDTGFCRVVQEPFYRQKGHELSCEMISLCLSHGVRIWCNDCGAHLPRFASQQMYLEAW